MDLRTFSNTNTCYGHGLDSANPRVMIWLERFKNEKGIRSCDQVSAAQRYEFETRIFKALGISYELLPGWKPNFEREDDEEIKKEQPA